MLLEEEDADEVELLDALLLELDPEPALEPEPPQAAISSALTAMDMMRSKFRMTALLAQTTYTVNHCSGAQAIRRQTMTVLLHLPAKISVSWPGCFMLREARMSAPLDPLTRLVAHRGNAFEFPENTLPALRSALQLGLRYIEFDVQLSADLVPMVMHDDHLKRSAQVDRDALSMDWSELQQVSVHEPARLGEQYAGTRIPALNEVAALLAEYPQAIAFVELKRASLRRHGAEQVLQRVYEHLKPVLKQVVIISFDLAAVRYAKNHLHLPIGWVLSEYSTLSAIKAEATLPEYLFCDQDKLPADQSRLWRGPWQWAMYEVTTGAQAASLITRGAQLLETMQVRKLLHELQPVPAA